jgi:hypothetical protein
MSVAACSGETAAGDPDIATRRLPPPGSTLYGTFEGKVPCADCERTKMALTLHRDADDLTPTSYLLERIFVGEGDDRWVNEGRWENTAGIPGAEDAVVCHLVDGSPPEVSNYLAIGDNLLLLLDENLEPKVGNAMHSFTLSRTR